MSPGRRMLIARLTGVGIGAILPVVPARAETIRVAINQLEFEPASVDARVGDTIEWSNRDVVAHTATLRGGWDVMIPAGKTATLVLKTPGEVEYYCRFHPNMKARLSITP